jgi:MinD superfamily P-loop ATPase
MAQAQAQPLILSDGPPGIGCPVISSLSGVNLAVIVTEPTPSGLHDLERIVDLCGHFKIPVAVIINKCDLNADITQKIEASCRKRDDSVVAKIPHDPVFVHAMVQGKAVTEYSDGATAQQIRRTWDHIMALAIVCSGQKAMAS